MAALERTAEPDGFVRRVLRRVDRQAQLMGEMMARLGIDPASQGGAGRGFGLAAASRRCLFCGQAADCGRWLAAGGGAAAPAFCPNRAYFDRLTSDPGA